MSRDKMGARERQLMEMREANYARATALVDRAPIPKPTKTELKKAIAKAAKKARKKASKK